MSDNGSFDEDSNTLIDASGIGFGATGAVGLELRARPIAKKAQLFFYGESGATGSTAVKFALEGAGTDEADINIGDLGYGGSYFRVGAGTRIKFSGEISIMEMPLKIDFLGKSVFFNAFSIAPYDV